MNYKLQDIVFPHNERFDQQWELFYRGGKAVYDRDTGIFYIPQFHSFEFTTYLNAFSIHKWRKYTNIQDVRLCLRMKGDFQVRLLGYRLDAKNPVKTELGCFRIYGTELKESVFTYPRTEEEAFFSFEIETFSPCEMYGGYYEGTYEPSDVRPVNLSIATTTFRKEDFIESNLRLLKKEILEPVGELREHIRVHVVDNGRTLDTNKWNDGNITVHPNRNVGGAGGFARGMIESLNQKPKADYVLLMDDDVLLLPESIRRLYRLLTVLRPEYREYFVSGAMLRYEEMNRQHEDVGFVHRDGSYGPLKDTFNHRKIKEILVCDEEPLERPYMYAGWWFCCVPISAVEKNGLPLPLFVRGDDVEFSLRNQARFITMNGICVWHMGFAYKFSASMELYQVHRNSLILQAVSGVCGDIDFISRMKKLFRARVLSLDYNGAELILDALEDYLKGPEFIAQDNGEGIMREKGRRNEKLADLKSFPNLDIDLDDVDRYIPRRFVHTWLYRLTYNGHRFCPSFLLKKSPGVVAFDWYYSPEANFWYKELLAVNPYLKTGALRTLDKERYRGLMKRKGKLLSRYKRERYELERRYRESKAVFTSTEFWKEYLGIS